MRNEDIRTTVGMFSLNQRIEQDKKGMYGTRTKNGWT
jgi:hypothetical protein